MICQPVMGPLVAIILRRGLKMFIVVEKAESDTDVAVDVVDQDLDVVVVDRTTCTLRKVSTNKLLIYL